MAMDSILKVVAAPVVHDALSRLLRYPTWVREPCIRAALMHERTGLVAIHVRVVIVHFHVENVSVWGLAHLLFLVFNLDRLWLLRHGIMLAHAWVLESSSL